jgi:uncharacterized membrane protein
MSVKTFFSKEQQAQIVEAIKLAEKNTSGEIRIHIENQCKEDVLDRAVVIFKKLKMHKTALRNGTLIYLALADHKFAILGDTGINQKVPAGFWDSIKSGMAEKFMQSDFVGGISFGIHSIGEKLKMYFPCCEDDVNELSDEISFGS